MNGHNKLECLSLASFSKPRLIFVGKVRNLPKSGEPEKRLTRVGLGLTREH
jgi:hypothetical protein